MNETFTPATDDDGASQGLLPIREVARLTGVNPVTLRAWERRYGLIVPQRTPKGHRLYSGAQIDQVRQVLDYEIPRGTWDIQYILDKDRKY